jgi:predicted TIM-barrel fold metal-dependent hydrolase
VTASVTGHAGPVLGVAHTTPDFDVPSGACDCHVHVFGPYESFPLSPDRFYKPGLASLTDLLAHQQALRLERVVIVQPSPYGTDNSCTVDALQRLGSRARGVAVVDADAPQASLHELHEAGIRGLRINLETSGVADPDIAGRHLAQAAAQAAPLGWHVQLYTDLSVVAALHDAIGNLPVPIVFDHFARAAASKGPAQPGFDALLSLMRRGRAYVKLSAPRRISHLPDHADAGAIACALAEANPERVLWGSDWPHPGARPGIPRHPDIIEPFHPDDDGVALNRLNSWIRDSATVRRILVENPAQLYGF